MSLNWFGELSAWLDDDVKVFEFDTTTRQLRIAFLDDNYRSLYSSQFMFDAAAHLGDSPIFHSSADAMEYAFYRTSNDFGLENFQHPIEIEDMVGQHTEGELTPKARTPEPSLILGFITVGGVMLGTRKKEKA